MTIPTREEALAMLDSIPSDYQQVDELKATLRCYIESHTGEVVAWITVETDGKVRTTHKKATADMWRAISGSKVSPLFASPVQPVKLEWKDDRLIFNGLLIGQVSESVYYPGVGFGYTFVKTPLTFAPTGPKWSKEEARAALEATARQWLSGGDK